MDFEGITYGELGAALCSLETEEQAAEFWQGYIAHLSRPDAQLLGQKPEAVAASNIGYLMGYYGQAERQRVYGLFRESNVAHPIFGTYEPTADEALQKGMQLGAGMRDG